MNRVVFLDRDGTIIIDNGYLATPENVALLPNAAAGLRAMQELACRLVIVSNQSGIGRRFFSAAAVDTVNRRLVDQLAGEGISIDGIFCCPHRPDEGCRCRKPAVGLIEQARAVLNLDLRECFVVGDKPCDWELGRAIGAIVIAICPTGVDPQPAPDVAVPDLLAAASYMSRRLNAG